MSVKVWSLSSGVCKLTLHGHQAAVTCVQFDKTKIISGALDTLIKIWNFNNGQVLLHHRLEGGIGNEAPSCFPVVLIEAYIQCGS